MSASDDRGPNVVILTSVFTTISVLSTSVRLAMRTAHHQLGWDDLAISLAVLFTIVSWPFTILCVQSGYGKHRSLLSDAQYETAIKWLFILEFNLFFTLPLTKVSICYFILRIKNTGWLKWFLYAMMVTLFLTNLAALVVLCAQCQPLYAYWDRKAGTCWSPQIYNDAIWLGVCEDEFSSSPKMKLEGADGHPSV